MKVSEQQLRGLIQEIVEGHDLHMPPDRAEDIFAMISEMGFRLNEPTWGEGNSIAIDDAMQGYPGEFTYEDVESAIKFIRDAGWESFQ